MFCFFSFLFFFSIVCFRKQAKLLFQQGIELERCGKAFEAMRLYRRAIQIVPDIELKMYELNSNLTKQGTFFLNKI